MKGNGMNIGDSVFLKTNPDWFGSIIDTDENTDSVIVDFFGFDGEMLSDEEHGGLSTVRRSTCELLQTKEDNNARIASWLGV